VARSWFLHVLNEYAVGAGGIHHADYRAACAVLRCLVDEREALTAGFLERTGHVVNLQGEVMDALAMRGQELPDIGLITDWLEQLDCHGAATEEGHPHIRESLFAAKGQAERGLEVGARLVDRPHGPTEMMNRGHYAAAPGLDLIGDGVISD
jgi:hypothetical protein